MRLSSKKAEHSLSRHLPPAVTGLPQPWHGTPQHASRVERAMGKQACTALLHRRSLRESETESQHLRPNGESCYRDDGRLGSPGTRGKVAADSMGPAGTSSCWAYTGSGTGLGTRQPHIPATRPLSRRGSHCDPAAAAANLGQHRRGDNGCASQPLPASFVAKRGHHHP